MTTDLVRMITDLVHCNKCNWTHFQVSAEYVKEWNDDWKTLCETKDEEWLSYYGITDRKAPDPLEEYGKCFRCGNTYKEFSDGSTCGDGHTIQPILNRNEDFL